MAKPQKIIGVDPEQTYHKNARIILPQKISEVYRWEQFIQSPEKREELHNMRISVKRLRYTMEFFAVIYDSQFTNFLDTIIELQDILGDIHDSDVALEVLTKYKNSCQSSNNIGVGRLISRTRKTRNVEYNRFLNKWEQLSASNFKQKLLKITTCAS